MAADSNGGMPMLALCYDTLDLREFTRYLTRAERPHGINGWQSLETPRDLVYASAKTTKAKAGPGVDALSPVDYQRLPLAAMTDELTDILRSAESLLAWPAQTQLI
eukprot:6918293-Pyramimonas_sp.AAC.1